MRSKRPNGSTKAAEFSRAKGRLRSQVLVVLSVVSMLAGSFPMALVGAETPELDDTLNGTVEGVVWSDSNSDDTRSDDEESFADIELSLIATDDTVVDSVVSGDSGEYRFDDVLPGEYSLLVEVPDGYRLSSTQSDDAALEPDRETESFKVGAAETVNLDLGLSPLEDSTDPTTTTTTVETTLPTTTTTVPPEKTVPDTSVPETTVPEITVPDTTVPEITVPDTTLPPDKTTTTEPQADDEEGAAPLSVSPAGTTVFQPNTFYAYVGAGENLDVAFTKVGQGSDSTDVTITVRGPGGVVDTCTVLDADPVSTACSWSDLTSGTPGVWQIDFPGSSATPGGGDRYTWAIDVQSGTTSIDGRVYSEHYTMAQVSTAAPIDLPLWYQSEQGFQYQADYTDYHGINSQFSSDATGVAQLDTCVAAYESMDFIGPNSDTGSLWLPALDSPGECGDPYKIFFENPDPSLPATAELWDGSEVWLQPPVTLPDLSNFAFTRTIPTTSEGEFTFDVANFTGQLEVQVDVNNDGDYTDPEDRILPVAVTQDGTVTVPFDGRDGQGNQILGTQALNARVAITRAGEIHFVNSDVETRSGLQVQALNGPNAGSTTIYWDDTDLESAGRFGTFPPTDGTAGVDSSGGVHGWVCDVTTGPACNANNGVNGSWGDSRNIDDWTFHTVDEFEEIAIPPGEPIPPFSCPSNAPGLLFQYPDTDVPPTSVEAIEMVTGADETAYVIDDYTINAVGYNVVDDYIYGYENLSDQLVRVGGNGDVEELGLPPGMPANTNFVIGDVDDNGHYWLYGAGGWWQVDLATMQLIGSGALAQPTPGTFGVDWAYIAGTNRLWRVVTDATNSQSYLTGFDRTTHTWTNPVPLGNLGGPGSQNGTGASFVDADGFLYASYNATGQIWRINVSNGTASFFSQGPASAGNDGARCANSPILLDFSDAPDSYGTTLASNGARHGIHDYDETNGTAPLMLGASVDPDTDGFPSAGADGDDADDAADEDGVADQISFEPGEPITVTVAVTNDTAEPATLAGWIDLDGNGVFDPGELVTQTITANTTGDVDLDFPAATATADTYARFRLYPSVVDPADISPTGAAAAGEVEDYTVPIEMWEATKTSDATGNVEAGDTVTYTITVENTGNAVLDDPTDLPSIEDDLSGVIDDAVYNDDADSGGDGTLSYSEPVLSWEGSLDVGQIVTITYTVTVNDADALGDGQLLNAITGSPNCPDPAITDPTDPDFDPDCVPIIPIRAYDVDKSADAPDPVEPGGTVEYTVVVTNTGGVDLVAPDAAEFSDDLTDVLDDATYNGDESADIGTVTFSDPELAWTGELLVDETATITYSVTVDAPITGNYALSNAVVGGDCPDPAITDPDDPAYDPDCVNITPLPGVDIEKVIFGDPVEELEPGDTFEYVVTVENIGEVDLVDEPFTDDLTEVLDDASLDEGSLTADIGTVSYSAPIISWVGDLAVGEVATISYSITIDDPITGDGELLNAVVGSEHSNCVPPDPEDPACSEETPLPNVEVEKTQVSPENPEPGDVVTYEITAENLGGAVAIDEEVSDDLSGVLDDAVYNDDATATGDGTLSYSAPTLTWVGDIAPGDTVTITYSVTVNAATALGDSVLDNVVTGGDNCPEDTEACQTETALPTYEASKRVVEPEEPGSGDEVTYEITIRNTGDATVPSAETIDDLSGVLDDAVYNDDATATAGSVSYSEPELTWTGSLGVDEEVTVTYSVTVNDDEFGDAHLKNTVTAPNCPAPECQTDTPLLEEDPSDEDDVPSDDDDDPIRELPFTGVELSLLIAMTLSLVAGGVLLLRAGRRPRWPFSNK